MTDTTYICGSCESKLEICDKEDGVIIVYKCQYCDEQEAIIARMLNGKMDKLCQDRKITRRVRQLSEATVREFNLDGGSYVKIERA